ncbi:MAG: right-handed parallel beta-helix repeat-containing protein [Acidobacteria bacterium]|nr:right-handed parallel beta-helix repeat-containing protein [Acidobacteriota bacterium]
MLLLIPRLVTVSVFALVVPAAVFAQQTTHADLSLNGPHLVTTNEPTLRWGVSLRNEGPDSARDVLVSVRASDGTIRWTDCPHVSSEGCLFPALGADVSDGVGVNVEVENAPFPGEVTVSAIVSSPFHDPNPRNNRISTTITRIRAPSLRFWISDDVPAGPGERVSFEANLFNDSPFEARDVRFSFHLPDGWSFRRSLSDSVDCTSTGRAVTCAMGDVEGKAIRRAELELEAPGETQGSIHFEPVTVSTKDGVFGNRHRSSLRLSVFRDLAVTNELDEGEGSLRKAIETANAECGIGPPCRIMFEIADDGSPVQTIRPLTALPAIAASGVTIEGATQTERIGDTNRDGPEIEINGSLLHEGNGLEFQNPFTLRNIVINGFPQNGVLIGALGTVEGCVIGADAAGTSPVPNGLRGVTVTSEEYSYYPIEIRNNLISGNQRSGIFVVGETQVRVIGNRIGVAAGPELRPLPNGASGIYFGSRKNQALVQKNVIAFNAHPGIATAPDAEHIAIRGNAIFSNGGLAIDRGLDGVSSEGISFHTPPVPVITSVLHDATTGSTTIRGTFEAARYSDQHVVEVFASDSADPSGYGEAQSPIGEVVVETDASFELRHEGDLGGRYVTATGTLVTHGWDATFSSTSELSRAVRVEGEADGEIPSSASLPDGADLSIGGHHFGQSVAAGVQDSIRFFVENLGPHVAQDVVVEIRAAGGVTLEDASQPCTHLGDALRCTLDTIGVAGSKSIQISIRTPLQTVPQVIEAVVSTQTLDPNPRNNQAVLEFDVTAEPVWDAQLTQSTRIADPGEVVVFDVTLAHESGLDASDVRVTLPIPEGWSFVGGSEDHWQCGQVSSSIVCRTPIITAGAVESFTFTLRAPEQYWGDRATSPSISSGQGEPRELPVFAFFETWKWLPVTTANDSGPGSLRGAIEELNQRCLNVLCKVVFEIPVEEMEAGAAVIRPLTPLPTVGAREHFYPGAYEIDGRTQPRDPDVAKTGPVVVLDGSLLTEGDGLELAGR